MKQRGDGVRVTRVQKQGRGYYVSVGTAALEALGLKQGDSVMVMLKGKTILIRKVNLREVFDQQGPAPAPEVVEG